MNPEREKRMIKNFELQLERDLKKYDELMAAYDKGIMGNLARQAMKRREQEKAREEKRKERIKPPTPFISVPGYTPPPAS